MKSIVALFVCLAVSSALVSLEVPSDISKAIDNQYIFTFREDISEAQQALHLQNLAAGFSSDHFDNKIIGSFAIGDFKGFSARLSVSQLNAQLASKNIIAAEQDAVVHGFQSCSQQKNAVWGLDRISERDLDLDGTYTYGNTGTGVDSYIIDTGINIGHEEFDGRAIWGANFVDNVNDDCNGHGTHVAGTVGGSTYGVAKATTLIAVKVLSCDGSGSNAGVVSGINWVVTAQKSRKNPSVANMSLGGGKSTATDNAVKAAIKAGIVMAVAAGNDNNDACNGSPSGVLEAISVGATGTDSQGINQVDNRAYFSNYGSCVSIFAPGLMIQSAWIGSDDAVETISGTSMATPHIAGMIANYLQSYPTSTHAAVKAWLLSSASDSIIDLDCSGATSAATCNRSPNVMAFIPCDL